MNGSDLKKVLYYHNYPRDTTIKTDKRSINIDNGEQGGTRWTCFCIKDNKSFFSTLLFFNLVNFYLTNQENQNFSFL